MVKLVLLSEENWVWILHRVSSLGSTLKRQEGDVSRIHVLGTSEKLMQDKAGYREATVGILVRIPA